MVTPGTVTSHKLPGASSGNLGDPDICHRQVRDTGNLADGQHYSSCIHHLPGSMNSTADLESRAHPDRSYWKLAPTIFQKIHHLLGPLSIDLFASRLLAQLPLYVSWKPEPLAMGTDAFSMDWSNLPGKIYANPPWGLIGRVLSRAHSQRVWEMVLVAPVWKAQAWYPLLLQMLVREPLIIPQSQEIIQPVCQNRLPDTIPQLAV